MSVLTTSSPSFFGLIGAEDGGTEGEPLDPLRGPVRGDLGARHAPHLLGVGLEEDGVQALAELVGHPLLEVLRIRVGTHAGFAVGSSTAHGLDRAERLERLDRLQGVAEVLAVVVDAGRARTSQEIIAEEIGPVVLDLRGLREEAVAADVEPVALVLGRPRDSANVLGICLKYRGLDASAGEEVGRGESRWSASDDDGVLGHRGRSTGIG